MLLPAEIAVVLVAGSPIASTAMFPLLLPVALRHQCQIVERPELFTQQPRRVGSNPALAQPPGCGQPLEMPDHGESRTLRGRLHLLQHFLLPQEVMLLGSQIQTRMA